MIRLIPLQLLFNLLFYYYYYVIYIYAFYDVNNLRIIFAATAAAAAADSLHFIGYYNTPRIILYYIIQTYIHTLFYAGCFCFP